MSDLRIRALIVDDQPTNLKLLVYLLSSKGYEVETAGDARSALEVLRRFKPRLILMDLQLPGMDGLALTRQLKADPGTRDIVIIAVTAFCDEGG
jgi:CheY-like chemotaxis protein